MTMPLHISNEKNSTISLWVEKYTSDLWRFAYSKLGDKELAEDLVQDTFISAFKAFDGFQGKSAEKTWLISILNNKIIDHYRAQTRKLKHEVQSNLPFFNEAGHWEKNQTPSSWDAENLLDDASFISVLEDCIKRLPANWSRIVRLKFQEDVDSKEICNSMDLSQTNYWQIIHRSKLQLRKCIDLNWFER